MLCELRMPAQGGFFGAEFVDLSAIVQYPQPNPIRRNLWNIVSGADAIAAAAGLMDDCDGPQFCGN